VFPYLLIAPFLVLYLVFWVGPIVISFALGFFKWDGLSPPAFVAVSNYRNLLLDAVFLRALKNTVWFVVAENSLMLLLALALAILISHVSPRSSTLFRVILFAPVTVALSVTALIFSMVYSRDYGLINQALRAFAIPWNLDWLGDPRLAFWSIVGLRVWRVTGYYMVFLWAGLRAIDRELLEAAAVDGASFLRQQVHIVLPSMRPVILFVLVMSSVWTFQVFEEPWILTRGGPVYATHMLLQYVYENAFGYFKFGYASAVSYVLTLFIILVSIIESRWLRD
jgi:ABC-type sugar transport system permease subunit